MVSGRLRFLAMPVSCGVRQAAVSVYYVNSGAPGESSPWREEAHGWSSSWREQRLVGEAASLSSAVPSARARLDPGEDLGDAAGYPFSMEWNWSGRSCGLWRTAADGWGATHSRGKTEDGASSSPDLELENLDWEDLQVGGVFCKKRFDIWYAKSILGQRTSIERDLQVGGVFCKNGLIYGTWRVFQARGSIYFGSYSFES
jgi:hypothetical protein